jgi:hypothetical protein
MKPAQGKATYDRLEVATIIPGNTNHESWCSKNILGFKRIKGYRPRSAHTSARGYSFPMQADLGSGAGAVSPQDLEDGSAFNMKHDSYTEHDREQTAANIIDVAKRKDNGPAYTKRPSTAGAAGVSSRHGTGTGTGTGTVKPIPNVPFLEAVVPPKLFDQNLVETTLRRKHQNHELDRVFMHRIEHSHPEEPTDQIVRVQDETDPEFSDETKIVCRYVGYLMQPRVWDEDACIGRPVVENEMVRELTFSYYIHDSTISIFEKQLINVGVSGGCFFAKGVLLHDGEDNCRVTVYDLIPGKTIKVLGRELAICSADPATRRFCREMLSLQLPPDVPLPSRPREDIGMHLTLGFGGKDFPPRADNKFPPTYEFYQRREQNMKTRRYLFNDARPLRFDCIEINDREDDGALKFAEYNAWLAKSHNKPGQDSTLVVKDTIRRNSLIYFIPDYCLEIQLAYWPNQPQKHREDSTILKRTKLQKNWREATKGKKEPTFYEPQDFVCGEVLDLYGRFYLVVGCDTYTQSKYQEMGVTQRKISVEMLVIPPILQPIPQLGDGFLAIGTPEETLATVYGQRAPSHDAELGSFKSNHRGKTLRCMMKLISDRPEDQQRLFALTFYIESDHISIYEEVVRNSGIWGGTFLNKGRYLNYLPDDGENPRYFKPQDIYLGNVISPNNVLMRIIEIDAATLKFCEANPDEFPLSDTFEIILRLLDEVVGNAVNARRACKLQDRQHLGAFSKEKFVEMLDSFVSSSTRTSDTVDAEESLSAASAHAPPPAADSHRARRRLNDHQLLTMLRRFKSDKTELYHYDELCDLFSHVYFVRDLRGRESSHGVLSSVAELEKALRPSKKQWRRIFRMDDKCVYGIVGAAHVRRIFAANRVVLSDDCLQEIIRMFPASKKEAAKYTALMGEASGDGSAGNNNSKDVSNAQSGASSVSGASHISLSSRLSTSTRGTISSLLSKRRQQTGATLQALSRGAAPVAATDIRASGTANALSVKAKRNELAESVLRPASAAANERKRSSSAAERNITARLDLDRSVANINAFFDDLFKSEWAF